MQITVQGRTRPPQPYSYLGGRTGPRFSISNKCEHPAVTMTQGSSRHPIEVEAIGLMQHRKQKTYMFSVLWSDHNEVLIYRTFEEFKKFQKELKSKFPLEAGVMKKSDRTIPKLKGATRTISKNKDSRRFLERLRELETYSQSLLKLDAKISQCDFVVQFFTLRNQDLNPSFPENSLVIMPSENKKQRDIIPTHNPDVSDPLVSLSYLCTADFDTVDLKNRPFRVKRNQLLDVIVKESTGWWLVENEDRQLAWFPAPYLKASRGTEEICRSQDCESQGLFCVVLKAYEAQNFDEISVSVGVVVEVLQKSDNGWWLISYNRRTGYIPSIYLKPYRNPCEKFQNILNRDRSSSNSILNEARRNGEEYALPHCGSSLDNAVEYGSNPEERERSQSLGSVSIKSDTRSFLDSDLDSLTGSSDNSSVGSSRCSLTAVESSLGVPKIPTRPKPDEIIQKCSTVTKRAVQKSLSRISAVEAGDSSGVSDLKKGWQMPIAV